MGLLLLLAREGQHQNALRAARNHGKENVELAVEFVAEGLGLRDERVREHLGDLNHHQKQQVGVDHDVRVVQHRLLWEGEPVAVGQQRVQVEEESNGTHYAVKGGEDRHGAGCRRGLRPASRAWK